MDGTTCGAGATTTRNRSILIGGHPATFPARWAAATERRSALSLRRTTSLWARRPQLTAGTLDGPRRMGTTKTAITVLLLLGTQSVLLFGEPPHSDQPEYPDSLFGLGGVVRVMVTLRRSGGVDTVTVVGSDLPSEFEDIAIRRARRMFRDKVPSRADGRRIVVPVPFRPPTVELSAGCPTVGRPATLEATYVVPDTMEVCATLTCPASECSGVEVDLLYKDAGTVTKTSWSGIVLPDKPLVLTRTLSVSTCGSRVISASFGPVAAPTLEVRVAKELCVPDRSHPECCREDGRR